ncbi:lipase family protein [Ferruginibacter yonginensis]|uniref:Lipase family protein n=1 Tax=Ferruginibacter yonginensis TaxID=1310416 RepID=A0ABV8QVZ7_9BACT
MKSAFIKSLGCLLLSIAYMQYGKSQQLLQPGFSVSEYKAAVACDEHLYAADSVKQNYPLPNGTYKFYESPEVGLYNKITFWVLPNNVALISIRGTTASAGSWIENFYSAMIPATGNLQINDSTNFNYKLAKDSLAYVHAGWTIGLAHLAPIAVNKINELYRTKGIKNFILFGHSQGGALSFLMRSYLQYCNQLPKDIFIKTYCSAAPKPGNLNYAYDFDHINLNGWAFRVVNPLDWVPESPFTVQKVTDMYPINPLANRSALTGKQSFFQRLAVNYAFKKMTNASKKTDKRYQKYLGKYVFKQVKQYLPQMKEPTYAPSTNYMTAGIPIVLQPDVDYTHKFKQTPTGFFVNHTYKAYLYLIDKNFNTQ